MSRGWIDSESYLLWATLTGLFALGSAGLMGTDDILTTFVAGCFLNCKYRCLDGFVEWGLIYSLSSGGEGMILTLCRGWEISR